MNTQNNMGGGNKGPTDHVHVHKDGGDGVSKICSDCGGTMKKIGDKWLCRRCGREEMEMA